MAPVASSPTSPSRSGLVTATAPPHPLAVTPIDSGAGQGGVVLTGAGGTAGASPAHVDLVDLVEEVAGMAGEQAREAGGEARAHHHRHAAARRLRRERQQSRRLASSTRFRHAA